MEKYRAWYIPQVPMESFKFECDTAEEAIMIYTAIVKFSIFEFKNRVKPDYSDAWWVQYYNEDIQDWEDLENLEWYEDWGDELEF